LNDISNLKISELNISNINDSEFDPKNLGSSQNIEKLKFAQKTRKENTYQDVHMKILNIIKILLKKKK